MSAAIVGKYARVSPWLRPAAAIFHTATPPIHVGVRLHVGARTLRVPATVATAIERQRRRAADTPPVAARLFERATRQTDRSPGSAPAQTLSMSPRPAPERPVPFRPPAPKPLPMVLARPAAAPAPAAMVTRDTRESRRPDQNFAPATAAFRGAELETAMTRTDVDRIADRVIGAIDRRMVAARERLHR